MTARRRLVYELGGFRWRATQGREGHHKRSPGYYINGGRLLGVPLHSSFAEFTMPMAGNDCTPKRKGPRGRRGGFGLGFFGFGGIGLAGRSGGQEGDGKQNGPSSALWDPRPTSANLNKEATMGRQSVQASRTGAAAGRTTRVSRAAWILGNGTACRRRACQAGF